MKKPRTLTDREHNLIWLYSQCQLGMTPREFYAKWDVSYEAIAFSWQIPCGLVKICYKAIGD
jgi:hypothetical protein